MHLETAGEGPTNQVLQIHKSIVSAKPIAYYFFYFAADLLIVTLLFSFICCLFLVCSQIHITGKIRGKVAQQKCVQMSVTDI